MPPFDAPALLRTSAWLLAAAAAFGLAIACLRFGFDRPSPPWLRRVHGAFATAGVAVLAYGWAAVGLPRAGAIALLLFVFTMVGGIVTARARRWRLGVSTEALAFGHLSIAALAYVMLFAAAIGGRVT